MAFFTISSYPKELTITTLAAASFSRILPSASSPSISGMDTSINTMSGRSSKYLSSASLPFAPSPTTAPPMDSTSFLKFFLAKRESSTMRNLYGLARGRNASLCCGIFATSVVFLQMFRGERYLPGHVVEGHRLFDVSPLYHHPRHAEDDRTRLVLRAE